MPAAGSANPSTSSGCVEIGIPYRFIQDIRSNSKRTGALCGLHFQCPPAAQAKLVGVLRGRILDVAVDVRQGSPTFGKYVATELSAESSHQLYIPVGFAHGFLTLEDDVAVMYKVTDYYAPAQDGGIRWDDPDIGVRWPRQDVGVSDKDRGLPLLKDFTSPFAYDGHPLGPLTATELG